MTRTIRFVSFLDRFEEQLEVDCERLKHELVDRVDRQFGLMRTKVREVKNRFGARAGHVRVTNADDDQLTDGPQVDTVSFEEWLREQRDSTAEQQQNMPSTLSGRKRASQSQARSTPKKRKSDNTNQTKKFACKFEGCGQSFDRDSFLRPHEHIHLGIKPYSCTWLNCAFSGVQRCQLITHIRMVHFKLPKSFKQQHELNIVDDRNPNDYIRVDQDLVNRRL